MQTMNNGSRSRAARWPRQPSCLRAVPVLLLISEAASPHLLCAEFLPRRADLEKATTVLIGTVKRVRALQAPTHLRNIEVAATGAEVQTDSVCKWAKGGALGHVFQVGPLLKPKNPFTPLFFQELTDGRRYLFFLKGDTKEPLAPLKEERFEWEIK